MKALPKNNFLTWRHLAWLINCKATENPNNLKSSWDVKFVFLLATEEAAKTEKIEVKTSSLPEKLSYPVILPANTINLSPPLVYKYKLLPSAYANPAYSDFQEPSHGRKYY